MVFVKDIVVLSCVILDSWLGSRADDIQEFIQLDKSILIGIKLGDDIHTVIHIHIAYKVIVHEFQYLTCFHMAITVHLNVIPKLFGVKLSNFG